MVPETEERPEISGSRAAKEGRGDWPVLILVAMTLDKPQGNQGIGQDAGPGTGYSGERDSSCAPLRMMQPRRRALLRLDDAVCLYYFGCELGPLCVEIDWQIRAIILPDRIVVVQVAPAANRVETEAFLIPITVGKS